MPFFFRPAPSQPAQLASTTLTQTGTVLAGDAGTQAASGVTYVDLPFEVSASTFEIAATTDWLVPAADQPDLDYQLLNPAGQVIGSSGAAGGPEFVRVRVSQPGTYTHRVVGFTNAATDFTVTTVLTSGGASPSLQPVQTEYTDAAGKAVDFDGQFTLAWNAAGGERGFEVERSTDGGQTWALVGTTGGDATSLQLADQPDGENSYRVSAVVAGRIGSYVTPPSPPAAVTVSRRTQEDITAVVQSAISNVSIAGGVFQLDQTLTNSSANTYVPRVELKIVAVNSASGTVSVANADNKGNGRSA